MPTDLRDNVSRVKRFNAVGTTIFVGLRAADVLLQYAILSRGWAPSLIEFLGGQSVEPEQLLTSSGHLQPYFTMIALMAFGSAFKQILAILVVSQQDTPPSSAVMIALFNTIFNSLNSVLSTWTATSRSPPASSTSLVPSLFDVIGPSFYLVGILTETISELQRTAFKKNPANKGKPYAGGLFSLARHINYGGYTIWRTSYAVSAGGWAWGLAVFAFFFYDFASRGVPVLDEYLSQRVSSYCIFERNWGPDRISSTLIDGRPSKLESRTVSFPVSTSRRSVPDKNRYGGDRAPGDVDRKALRRGEST